MRNDGSADPFADVLPFVRTAEAASFTTAARQLGVTPSSVSRAVGRLEASLGVRLLRRSSRSVTLTADGALFLERSREALDALQVARALVTKAHHAPEGTLRVTMPLGLGRAVLLPAMPEFLNRYPQLRVHVQVTDRLLDLVRDDLDVAVRVGALTDSTAVARQVGTSRFVTIAAPSYLSTHGRPRRPGDLVRHRGLKFQLPNGRLRAWSFAAATSARPDVVAVPTFFVADSGESLVELAVAGVGIAQAPDYLARTALGAGKVEELFRATSVPAGAISCLRHGRHAPSRVRAFIDFVAAAVGRTS